MTKKKGDDSELVKKNIKETLDKDAKTSAKRKSLKKTEQQSNKLPRKVYKEVPFLEINFASLKCKALIVKKVLSFVVDVLDGKANVEFEGPTTTNDKLKQITKCCQCVVDEFDVILIKGEENDFHSISRMSAQRLYDTFGERLIYFFAYLRDILKQFRVNLTVPYYDKTNHHVTPEEFSELLLKVHMSDYPDLEFLTNERGRDCSNLGLIDEDLYQKYITDNRPEFANQDDTSFVIDEDTYEDNEFGEDNKTVKDFMKDLEDELDNLNSEDIEDSDDMVEEIIEETTTSGGSLTVPENERPGILCIIPIYGRPFIPTQVSPIQLDPRWEETVRTVLDSSHKMLALVALPENKNGQKLEAEDFMKMACLVRIIQARIGSKGEIDLVVNGLSRVQINEVDAKSRVIEAKVSYPKTIYPSDREGEVEVRAYTMSILSILKEIVPLNPMYFEELKQYLSRFGSSNPSNLTDCAASLCVSPSTDLQKVLEALHIVDRQRLVTKMLQDELEVIKLQQSIKKSVEESLNEHQRRFFLNEQLKEIKKQLGITVDDKDSVIQGFKDAFSKLNPPEDVKKRFEEEISRISTLDPNGAEYSVSRDYLKWITSVPWGITSEDNFDLKIAKKILNADHEGLEDVKERILEFLAVGAYKKDISGAILLLVGPPGVGKTSIGKSVAKALNRPFYRFSVGGMRDEAEIKGHRRTYVGALPGRFVQALKETKVCNPVIMLDEIDKISKAQGQGDPSSALLETLDPEQNSSFLDHYLDLRLDLSKCLFVCTANSLEGIPGPLLDRMDKISLSGYLAEEKQAICKKHLIPKSLEKAGVSKKLIKFTDASIKKMVDEYAREAGVRSLEKCVDKIVRKNVVKLIETPDEPITVKPADLKGYLGVAPFTREKKLEGVGIITGLAWTSMGGATLPIEARLIDNSARGFKLTGNLGNVMKESAEISLSYVISNLKKLAPEADQTFFEKSLIHLHVPEGATPKDGPSAGITMASALLSLAKGKAPKKGYAMTGELSLTGTVLAIGGIREKVVAAKRIGISKLIVPSANKCDVEELPDYVKAGVEFNYADTYEDVAKVLF